MEYKDLLEVNKEINTIDVKGKQYAEVPQRIKAFRKLFPNGSIETEIVTLDEKRVVMKCTIKDENGKVLATAHAYENEGSSFINKTSFIENCCTSCTGRALGYLGIGIDTSVASYEEVANAMEQQKKIDNIKITALEKAIENANIPGNKVTEILAKFNYKRIADIQVIDYMNVVNAFKEAK